MALPTLYLYLCDSKWSGENVSMDVLYINEVSVSLMGLKAEKSAKNI